MKNFFTILFLIISNYTYTQNNLNLNLLGTYEWNSTEGSDIWGWADPNGNEYALVGLNDGFSVVDVTNPTNPVEMFYIADLNSTWRDIKTWGNYAYVTTEADAGLLIVDLSDINCLLAQLINDKYRNRIIEVFLIRFFMILFLMIKKQTRIKFLID